jgi:hypothetical protein
MTELLNEIADLDVKREATISACGLYRYDLHRVWGNVDKTLPVVMVNPSKADASIDDPTITDLMKRARRWGYGAIVVMNLFAFRATDPSELDGAVDPIGPRRPRCSPGLEGRHRTRVGQDRDRPRVRGGRP